MARDQYMRPICEDCGSVLVQTTRFDSCPNCKTTQEYPDAYAKTDPGGDDLT